MNEAKKILDQFKENVSSVNRLANFDRVVLDYSIKSIEDLQARLNVKFKNESLLASGTLKQLKTIRKHDSMRGQYQEIFNQCVVLLVSYFGSTVSDIFNYSVTSNISDLIDQKAFTEEFKFSPKELSDYNFNLRDQIGEIIITKKGISFQDMKSINRAFRDFLNIDIRKNKTVNDIILGQACRHIIVHSGSIVDNKMMKQIADAKPRDLKPEIKLKTKVVFNFDEIEILAMSMQKYLETVIGNLETQVTKEG